MGKLVRMCQNLAAALEPFPCQGWLNFPSLNPLKLVSTGRDFRAERQPEPKTMPSLERGQDQLSMTQGALPADLPHS